MKKFYFPLLFLVVLIITSCVPSSKYQRVINENNELNKKITVLEAEIDDLKNGADKLFAEGNKYFENKKYNEAIAIYQKLIDKHPEDSKANESKKND